MGGRQRQCTTNIAWATGREGRFEGIELRPQSAYFLIGNAMTRIGIMPLIEKPLVGRRQVTRADTQEPVLGSIDDSVGGQIRVALLGHWPAGLLKSLIL